VAIVTGATAGIGRSTARQLARLGMCVVVGRWGLLGVTGVKLGGQRSHTVLENHSWGSGSQVGVRGQLQDLESHPGQGSHLRSGSHVGSQGSLGSAWVTVTSHSGHLVSPVPTAGNDEHCGQEVVSSIRAEMGSDRGEGRGLERMGWAGLGGSGWAWPGV
jgi:hypothetical protein